MTIILHNGTAAFQIGRAGWGRLLALAQTHGWQPVGTKPPQWNDPHMQAAYGDRTGFYTSVTSADAQALAAALERALSNLSDPTADTPESNPLSEDVRHLPQPSAAASDHAPQIGFSCKNKAEIIEFVDFAKQGCFSILSAPSAPVGNAFTVIPL